jgi:hypothetical protein
MEESFMAEKKIAATASNMTPREVFFKTMPFAWAKLLLGLATVVASAAIFAIMMGIAYLFKSGGVGIVMIFIWIGATGVISFVLNHYIGYLVKAGHVAVITETVTTGRVPENQVEYGKQLVKERFAMSNVYFVLDKLISAAVRQIQRVVRKITNVASFVPGMKNVQNIVDLFINIALGYIDECCLGYTFLNKKESAFKCAADGVVIYWQNWKTLLKDAAKTTLTVVILIVVVTIVAFLVFGMIFVRLLHWNGFVAFLIAVLVAWAVKKAFIDSYMMVKMMVSYMEVAPSTQITFDLYNKLCGLSTKFKQLFDKGKEETPALQSASAKTPVPAKASIPAPAKAISSTKAPAPVPEKAPVPAKTPAKTPVPAKTPAKGKQVFCTSCGAKNESGAKFCSSCGAKLG